MHSFMLLFFMLVLTDTVKCERRCDIRRISGCMNPENTDKISKGSKGALCEIYEMCFISLFIQSQT